MNAEMAQRFIEEIARMKGITVQQAREYIDHEMIYGKQKGPASTGPRENNSYSEF